VRSKKGEEGKRLKTSHRGAERFSLEKRGLVENIGGRKEKSSFLAKGEKH